VSEFEELSQFYFEPNGAPNGLISAPLVRKHYIAIAIKLQTKAES
jgi:hypothetical protein